MAPHQARLHLILGTDPRRLLEHAAADFLVPLRATPEAPFPSPPALLALRQGGLRDDLLALAHERGVAGWYDPPLCTFQELPAWLGATDRRALGDLARRALLARLVRGERGVFGGVRHPERFVHALDRLVGELAAEETSPDAVAATFAARAGRDDFERRRDQELAAIYRGYCNALEQANARDARATYADCARALAAAPDQLTTRLRGRRELRLFGLQDLSGGWRPLLRALLGAPALDRVVIYSTEALPLDAALGATTATLDEPASLGAALFGAVPEARPHRAALIAAPDAERELEEVARRVRALVQDGVPLHRIGVVARQARPHADLAAEALARFGVPATQRRRHPLRGVPVVRALDALLGAAAEGWTRHALAELADQPYFANELDAESINAIGYARRVTGLDAWTAELVGAGKEAEAEAFARFAERARPLERPRPLAEWVEWLGKFVVEDPWEVRSAMGRVPAGRLDVVRLDLLAWERLPAVLTEWAEALRSWGAPAGALDAAGFRAELELVLEQELAVWSANRRGVPVLEGLAAAYRSFDHLFLVGLEAGRFPVRAPTSPLLDDTERTALAAAGLPLEVAAEWDRRERALFRVLAAGARQRLTLSYSRLDPAGREVARSAFIEAVEDAANVATEEVPASRVHTPGARLLADPALCAHAEHAARVELDRARDVPSPWNGLIVEPALVRRLAVRYGEEYRWSPTQLEQHAKCPWAYFSARLLRVEGKEDPDDEMDARTVGSVYHRALQRFYDAERARRGEPVLIRPDELEEALPRLADALTATLAEMEDTSWLGNPVMAGAKRLELHRTLRRYLEFEAETNRKLLGTHHKNVAILRTGVQRHEMEFDDVVLARDGIRLRYTARVDRVEVGIDDRVDAHGFVAAVDYKTSKSAAPGAGKAKAWVEGVVLQGPLYAHALASAYPEAKVSRVEYRAIRQRELVHRLHLYEVDNKRREVRPSADGAIRMEQSLESAVRVVRRTRNGEFPAAPPSSCGCPDFCHARDICRVAGGPRKAT